MISQPLIQNCVYVMERLIDCSLMVWCPGQSGIQTFPGRLCYFSLLQQQVFVYMTGAESRYSRYQ
ncbi:hypothetical protein C1H46_033929 [Malus baccata]|uniref:Uncharacterized protein n=1 Tax=Malus baccata TaxID=106549 RepID=A0A540L200_MALBA|nr:hypothetical protein C1H46_033929 [Malus baccata]